MNNFQELLAELRNRNIRLWVEGDSLRYKSPEGRLPEDLRGLLIQWKEDIKAWLQSASRHEGQKPIPQISREGTLPIAPAQVRLLILDQLQENRAVFNLPKALRLRGDLNVAAMKAALAKVCDRHESLRTTFPRAEQGGHQLRINGFQIDLAVEDLAPSALESRLLEQACLPFDLATGPLIRAGIFRLAPQDHVLYLTLHHIISDGWSTAVLVNELRELYQAFSLNQPAMLAPLRVGYPDYATWHATWLESPDYERKLAYWKQQLSGMPALLGLPSDYPRPGEQSQRGETFQVKLPESLSLALIQLAKDQSVSLFILLMAAWQVLLTRLTGQEDLAVATPVANRLHPDVEPLIGLFFNTIVLRGRSNGNPRFLQFLAQIRQVAVDGFSNQAVPFDRIVDSLNPERSLSYNPLYQAMFMLQNVPAAETQFAGLECEPIEVGHQTSKVDLTWAFQEREGTLFGSIEFDSALFKQTTQAAWFASFQHLLEGIVADPSCPILQLPVIPGVLQDCVLNTWNQTELPFTYQSICELFEARVRAQGDETALTFGATSCSYEALNQMANRMARQLQETGLSLGERVGIHMSRGIPMVVSLLAVLKAGAAYVPLDPHYPQQRLKMICDDALLALVLHDNSGVPLETGVALAFDLVAEAAKTQLATNLDLALDPEMLAYMIYTSGSTGTPKGVMVAQGQVANLFQAFDQHLQEAPGKQIRWLAVTSISFDISVLELFWTLSRGYHVVIAAERMSEIVAPTEGQNRSLDFSLFYFASENHGAGSQIYDLLLEGARFGDEHGFEAIWVPERHFHAFGGQFPAPAVAAAAVAVVTKRIAIRSGSQVLPLNNPIQVAEQWAMVDNLSNGRVGMAIASGWHPNDFLLAPDRYNQRHQIMREQIELLRHLWRGGLGTAANGMGKETEYQIYPRPVSKELPLWITTAGNQETYIYAGETGGNVLTHMIGQSITELKARILAYRAARASSGFDPLTGKVTVMIHTFVGDDLDQVTKIVKEPFKAYLRSSVSLIESLASAMGVDLDDDREVLIDSAFERFYRSRALLGTPESCLEILRQLKAIGVDEVACLIDFGVPAPLVIESFKHLDRLRQLELEERQRTSVFSEWEAPADLMIKNKVNQMQATPSFMRQVLLDERGPEALAQLEKLLIGGEALAPELVAQLKAAGVGQVFNVYGPTETTVWSCMTEVEANQEINIGRPIANTGAYVLNPVLMPAPPKVWGELYLAGKGVTQGYWRRPSLTATRFVPHPFAKEPGARIYRTGDSTRFLEDGRLEFGGRTDHQVKLRGFRIELGEIRAAIVKHEAVADAVVLVQNSGADASLIGYIVPQRRPQIPTDPTLQPFTLPQGLVVWHHESRQLAGLHNEIFEEQYYMRHGIELRDGDVVFDVGANVGGFSIFVRRSCKDARVFAFEPIPRTYSALAANFAYHQIEGKPINLGLSNKIEQVEFTFYPTMPGLSSRFGDIERDIREARSMVHQQQSLLGEEIAGLSESEIQETLRASYQAEQVPCHLTTLSDIIDLEGITRIDLLKIDVEKSEVLVLEGIRQEHWARIGQVTMEIDGRENLGKVRALLLEQGFEVVSEDLVVADGVGESLDLHAFMLYATRPALKNRPGQATPASQQDQPLTGPLLRSFLNEQLPDYMVPAEWVFLDTLPLTPNGKLDVKALPQPSGRPELGTDYLPPRNDLETLIAGIWSEVLKKDQIGINDNFFELGGSSLRMTQVLPKLRAALAKEMRLIELFKYPTVSSLAAHLSQKAQPANFDRADSRAAQRRDAALRRTRVTS